MKRLIAAVSLAVLAAPALAQNGKPFEQLDLDRALPEVNIPAVEPRSVDPRSLPYEQAQLERELPSFDTGRLHYAAASGATMSDASTAAEPAASTAAAESPWANDPNFIAPAP